MGTQHKPSVPLGAIAMMPKGSYWHISNIIIKDVFKNMI